MDKGGQHHERDSVRCGGSGGDGSYRSNAVGQAIHTEADSLIELHQEIRDAVHCHFDEGQAPPLIRLHHVRQELLTL